MKNIIKCLFFLCCQLPVVFQLFLHKPEQRSLLTLKDVFQESRFLNKQIS